MQHYFKEKIEVTRLSQVTCSKCGKNMSVNFNYPECVCGIVIKERFGYGSRFDGIELKLDLCDNCVEDLVRDCNYATGTVNWPPDDKDKEDVEDNYGDYGPLDPHDEFGR